MATVLLVLVTVEAGLGLLALAMAAAENCDNGVDRWECNGTVGTSVILVMILLPIAVVAAVKWRRRRGWDGRPHR
jgi:hypothetical protein